MKNYILALMLIPLLLHGQKFRDSEVKITKDGGGKRGSETAVMESVPRLLSYQGFLTVGNAGPVSDGQYTVDFRLFDEEEGGSEFWTETHLVNISDGLVSALLGSNGFPIDIVPMNSYLEIEINGNVLSPRQQITSVLYSVLSDSTNFAKGYTKTVDLSEVAHSGEYVDLLNTPDLTPFATKDTLSNFATMDTLFNNFTLSSQLSVVAFSNNYYDLDSLPNLENYAVTDTLDYYVTEVFFDSTIENYVSHDSLDSLIDTDIQRWDEGLEEIAMLDDDGPLPTGYIIIYEEDTREWVSQGGNALRNTLGLGTMSTQDSSNVVITGGTINGIDPIAVESGGTGASSADTARMNLDAQKHSEWLDDIAGFDLVENDDANQIIMSLKGGFDQWNMVDDTTARVELGLKIGTSDEAGDVQAWDSKLQNFSDGEPIPDSLIFSGDYFITTPGVEGQFWSADGDKAGFWRSFSSQFNNLDNEGNLEETISIQTTFRLEDSETGIEDRDIVEVELVDHGAETNAGLPEVDGSQLFRLDATQINSTKNNTGPVSIEQFDLLQDLRTELDDAFPEPEYTSGNIQGQLDEKQKKYPALDEIGQLEPEDFDVLMWMSDPGEWSLVTENQRGIKANRVEFGNLFINEPGLEGQMWVSRGMDPDDGGPRGHWVDGADISRVHTDPNRGLFVGGDNSYAVEDGDVLITVDAGTNIHQIIQLTTLEDAVNAGAGSGSLPIVDGSLLTGLDAEQINSDSEKPVSNEQFHLLTDLRTELDDAFPEPEYTSGNIQGQLDEKQKKYPALDEIGQLEPEDFDVLMWMSDPGEWSLVTANDGYTDNGIPKDRINNGQFFISSAGGTGEIWMSKGSEKGVWAETGPHINSSYNENPAGGTLKLNVYPEDGGKVIVVNDDNMLPAVDGSQLHGINATQINSTVEDPGLVSNDQFDLLQDLRTGPDDAFPEPEYTSGNIQGQLDEKQKKYPALDEIGKLEPALEDVLIWLGDGDGGEWSLVTEVSEEKIRANRVEYGEYFIKSAGQDEMVWTWDGTEADGYGSWIMPPGAQVLNDLEDASTENTLQNVFIGSRAGENITNGSGSNNAGFGMSALQSVGNGNENVALGIDAGLAVNNNNANVLVGYKAGSNLETGDRNVLIGYKSGEDLTTGSDQLIIDNSSADQNFIEGSFATRDLMIDGQLFSTRSLHLGSSADPKFTIEENLGDITIKSEGEGNNITFGIDGYDNLLTMDFDGVIKLSGETKLASDETNNTYINFDESGSNLNLTGDEDVVVSATKDVVVKGRTMQLGNDVTEDVVVNATSEFTLNGGNISLSGDEISITTTLGQGNEIKFLVDDTELLIMDDDEMIKLGGTTKLGAENDSESYINATDNGVRLNVKGSEKVLVHAVNNSTGVVQLLAADSINLDAMNVVITSGNEFTVDSDFKARGKVTIVDGSDSLSIHGDHAEGVTISNEFEDRDIIFNIETGEVMRLEQAGGSDEALRLNGTNWIRFGDDDISMRKNEEDNLAIRNFRSGGDILFRVEGAANEILRLNGDADGEHSVEIKATIVDIDAAITEVSNNLLVGDTLKVGAGDNILTVSQANGDVFLNNNALNKDVVFNVTRSGSDEAMRIDGQDLFLNVTNKIKVTNDATADPVAGSELRFINTGLPANTDVTDLYPLATISAQADNIVSSQILMEDATVVGGNQGVISFDVMVDGQLVTLMEMNTPSREDDSNYDSTITIPHNMDVVGDLYTNTMEFAERIVPDEPGGAEIGSTLLPWGDLYLYDGNGIGADASASSAHIYFKNEDEEDADVEISHQPGDGIRIKGEKQIQFNSANTYIYGSGTNPNEILNLVAPNLTMAKADGTDIQVNVEGNINPLTITIGADNNEFTITENPSVPDEILITSAIADKDIVFSTNYNGTADTEVMRIVGANASLQMDEDKKIEFRDANTYIQSGALSQLTLVGDEVVLTSSTDAAVTAKVEGTLKAETGLTLYEGEDDEFRIYQSDAANDYVIKNETVAKDLLFVVDKAADDLDVEVMRVAGADGSLRMSSENPVQFFDADHYIKIDIDDDDPDLKPLNVVAQGANSIIKIGKAGQSAAATTDSIAVVGNKVQVFTDNFGVQADNQFIVETDDITMTPYTNTEAPALKLLSSNASSNPGTTSLPAELVLERNSGAGFDFETIGKIVAKGQPNPAGENPQEFASILFKSPHVVADVDGLQGGIYFKTEGTSLDEAEEDELMDINGTTKNTVTIRGDLDVNGAITMNGASFTAPITSDEAGEWSLGTQDLAATRGEWAALHLWNSSDIDNAKITFGGDTEDEGDYNDVELEHTPDRGLTINDEYRFQFRDNETFIHSSDASILDIVAPNLNIDSETAFTSATSTIDATTGALKVTGGISTQENLYVGGTATVNGVFTVGEGGDEFSITESSDDVTIDNSVSDKDIIFTVNTNTESDTEILRVVGADASLRMSSTKPLEFNASTNSIRGTTPLSLTVASPNIRLNASGAEDTSVVITNSETTVNNELELQDSLMFAGGSDEFVIKPVGALGDYGIKNLTQDKDIIIKTNSGGTDTEVARVVGATASLQMDEEQKLEFKQASNYINATEAGATLNLVTGGKLAMNAATMTLQGTDDLLTITKNLASEELTSATQKNPVLTISNTADDAFGGILELKKAANAEDGGVLGSIISSGTGADNEYAKIDFESKTASDATAVGAIQFSVHQGGGAYTEIMDINKLFTNTVTIGTENNAADLKVYGDLLASTTAYEADIRPGQRGIQDIGSDGVEWGNVWLAEDGVVSFGGEGAEIDSDDDDVELSHVQPSGESYEGLLLNGINKLFFEDYDENNGLDQFIGSKTADAGITVMKAPTEIEIDGGVLVDVDGESVTIDATGVGAFKLNLSSAGTGTDAVDINATAGGLDVDALNTSDISVTAADQTLTLATTGAGTSKLILSSAGTGTDAVDINATAGGLDVDALNTSAISVTADDQTLTVEAAGARASKLILSSGGVGTDAVDINATAGGLDIDALNTSDISVTAPDQTLTLATTGAGTSKLILSSAGTGADAIEINATAGGVTAKVVDEKNLVLGNAESNAYFKVAASNDAATEKVEIKNTVGTAADAFYLDASAGGVAINAGLGLTIDAASALEINSSGGTISVGNEAHANNIEIGNVAIARTIIVGQAADPSTTTEVELNGVIVDINAGSGGLDIDASGTIDIAVATAPAATDGSSINLTAGTGGTSDQAGGNIILTPGTKSGSGTDGLVAIDGPSSSPAELYLRPNAATADDRWKITAVSDADGGTLTMSSFEADVASPIMVINQDGSVTVNGQVTATGGFAGDMASDELTTENQMEVSSNQQAADAVKVWGKRGGVLVKADGDYAEAIKLHATAGPLQTIVVENTAGTDNAAIALTSTAGGITAKVADEKTLQLSNTDGDTYIKLNPSVADAVNETIQLVNAVGTDDAAIALTSTAGGITAKVADGKNLTMGNADSDAYFKVAANSNAANEAVQIVNTAGTDPAAINLESSAGGVLVAADGDIADAIKLHATVSTNVKAINLESSAGGVLVAADGDMANAIKLHATAGPLQTIVVENTAGTDNAAIALTSTAGGITAKVADEKILQLSNTDGDTYIKLNPSVANVANETIQLINAVGTASGSIEFTSSAGGVDINAATVFTVAGTNFSISDGGLVSSTLGFAGPMTSSQMTSSDPIVISSSNNAPNSVQITSTVGGIDISALGAGPTEDIDIVATGSSVNISSSEGGGALNAITINASAGGIDINSALAFDVASSASVAFSSATTTTIDATGVLDIDGANTTIDAAGTLTIKGTGVSKYGDDVATLNFDGSGAVTQTDMTNVTIDPSGTLTMQGAGVSKYGDDIATLNFDGSGVVTETDMTSMVITPSGVLEMQGGGISKYGDDVAWWKFDGDGAVIEENMTSIAITPSAALTLTAGAASTLSTTASALTLTGGAASTWSTSDGILTVSGDDGLVLTAANSAGITMNSINGEFLVTATGQDIDLRSLSLTGDFTGALSLDAVGTSNLTNDGALTVAATGGSGALTLTGAAASTWSTSAGELTLDGAAGVNIVGNAGEVDITTTGTVEMNSSSIDIKNIAGTTAGLLRLYEDPSTGPGGVNTPDFIAFKAGNVNNGTNASAGGGFTFTWPNDYGTDGQVLKTNGSGVMTWVADQATSGSVTNSNVFGSPLDGTDVSMSFDGHTHSGLFKWMEDEDKFEFHDHILMTPVSSTKLQFGDPEVYIWSSLNARLDLVSDGSIVIDAGTNINLEPTLDVILPANIGLVFGDGESIEGNNTDLTVTSGADIILSATTNVNIPQTIGLSFATDDAEKISSDGTDLTVTSGADIILSATTNVNIPQTKGLSFATDDAEKISSDGTNLTVTSGADIILSATTNVNIPQTKGLSFATDDAEKISSDGTNLTVTSGGSLILTASGISGTAIKDEDNMASDSPTHLASQQSIKTYVDDQASAAGTLTNKTLTTPQINDASSDHQYVFAVNELVLDRTVTLPLLGGNDEFVFKDHIQTLTNKTLTSPKLNEDVAVTTTGTELNLIAGGTARGTDAIANGDGVLINDAGTMKMTTVETLAAYVSANLTVGGVLNADIGDDQIDSEHYVDASIDFSHFQDVAANSILARNASDPGVLSEVVLTDTKILIGDGTGFTAAALSGDATMTNGGVVDIAADAITAAEIADGAISEEHLDPTVISGLTVETGAAGDYVLIWDATDSGLKKALVEQIAALARPEAPPTPTSSSDMRFKKNISTVSGALEKLSKLNPVNYDWRNDEFKNKGFNDKKQWGFIAQEVEKVMPELVGVDKDDYLTLNYTGFVPLLTKAMQEQQTEIENQQREIDELKAQLEMIMKMMQSDMSDKTDNKKAENNEKPVKLSMSTVK